MTTAEPTLREPIRYPANYCPSCGAKLAHIVSSVCDDMLRGLARYQCDQCGVVFDLRYVDDPTGA